MIGHTIHNCKIIEKIGEGGMGVVYLGEDIMLGRKVAVKVLRPHLLHDESLLERFKSEARILSRLNHPNIAGLYNFFSYENTYCMVMEYVDGEPLDELLKKNRRVPPEIAANMIYQALEGLNHAHRRNIIHRDIKLSNLILSRQDVIKIMDFGIARAAGSSRLTSTGRAVGTLEYMSPEQIRGQEGGEQSDLYSLGIVLYELLTGQVPFKDNTEFELMKAHLEQRPPTLREKVETLPLALEEVVAKALEKAPERRYANAKAFQQALSAGMPTNAMPVYQGEGETRVLEAPTKLMGSMDGAGTKSNIKKRLEPFLLYLDTIFQDSKLLRKAFLGTVAGVLLFFSILFSVQLFSKNEPPKIAEEPTPVENVEDPTVSPPATTELPTDGPEEPSGVNAHSINNGENEQRVEQSEQKKNKARPARKGNPSSSKPNNEGGKVYVPTAKTNIFNKSSSIEPKDSVKKAKIPEDKPKPPPSSCRRPSKMGEDLIFIGQKMNSNPILLRGQSVTLEFGDGFEIDRAFKEARVFLRTTNAVIVDGVKYIDKGQEVIAVVKKHNRPKIVQLRIESIRGANGQDYYFRNGIVKYRNIYDNIQPGCQVRLSLL